MTRYRHTLAAVAMMMLPAVAGAAESDTSTSHTAELEVIEVRALPLRSRATESARPVSVLTGEMLDDRKEATLGETLRQEPGIHSTYFGPGAGRPIIRGLGGTRVRITEDGLGSLDASALSPDHAVSAEPLLIDRVEVLRGPANVLYGSSASAGVVNLIDNRVPEQRQSFGAAGELRGNSVAGEFAAVGRVDGGLGPVQFHLDGFYRDTDDYEIPGFALTDEKRAELAPAERDEQERGELGNSALETEGGTLGLSYVGDWGFLGASYKRFDTTYGVPAELEAEEEEAGEEPGEEEEGGVSIDLEQERWDVKGALFEPVRGVEEVRIKLATNDYQHIEFEGDEVGTVFDVDGTELRAEVRHMKVGRLEGVVGIQYEDLDLSAVGAEAFLPAASNESLGVFVLEEYDLEPLKLSLGLRWQDDEISLDEGVAVDGIDSRDFTAISISAGGIWQINDALQTSLNWQRSERSPTQAELFANGPHVAIQTFEIGNPDLDEEVSNNLDFGIHYDAGGVHLGADFYYNDIEDFVFLAETDEVEDGFPVRVWSQADAEFYGVELQASYAFDAGTRGRFEVRGFFDAVEADIDAGNGELPRLPASRFGAELDWHRGPLRANLGYTRIFEVDDTAEFETATSGYDSLTANVVYLARLQNAEIELFLKGQNLTDDTQRVHTSFLKDFVPRPGLNVSGGVRARF